MNSQVIIKRVIYVLCILIALAGVKAFSLYRKAFAPNIFLSDKVTDPHIYIKTGSDYEDVIRMIKESGLVRNYHTFIWVAEKKNYCHHVIPGRYKIDNRMSNNELINTLRSGRQDPVMLVLNNIRTLAELAGFVSTNLEIDSVKLLKLLRSETIYKKYGFNKYTIKCMFIPNSYEFYWNTSAEKFLRRMHKEYLDFWTVKRIQKAEKANMSKEEIIILASIVNEETSKDDEKERIAGLYMNRLEKGMRLQADPTVIYAIGNFSIQRVLKSHYSYKSLYNTYLHEGLPPGPICIPEISSIDAVLNYEKHDYIYMCAKPDFSGYHNFAKTLKQHNKYALLYRKELNKRRIYK